MYLETWWARYYIMVICVLHILLEGNAYYMHVSQGLKFEAYLGKLREEATFRGIVTSV
jgi:hypothetical protein